MRHHLLIVAVLPLASCAVFDRPSEVRNRFATAAHRDLADPAPTLAADPDRTLRYTASLSSNEVPSTDREIAITDLSDRGQAAYVEAFAARAKDDSALIDAIGRPDKASPAAATRFAARGKIERRLILSLLPASGMLGPGDRLHWARVRIVPKDQTRFANWTLVANKETAIDVGSVKATQSDTLSAETGLALGKPFVDAKLTAESSRGREETGEIRDETTINARLEPTSAEIVQAAGWRDDLTGNATFDVTLQVPTPNVTFVHSVGTLWAGGKPKKPNEVRVARQTIDLPVDDQPLCATLELDYVVRHILLAQNSHTEADDKVEFVRGQFTSRPQMLAPPPRYERWAVEGEIGPVHLERGGRQPEVLALRTREEALDLIEWLSASGSHGATVADGSLVVLDSARLSYRKLRASDIPSLFPRILSGGPTPVGQSEPACS